MAQVTLKIKLDLPALRSDLQRAVNEIRQQLGIVGDVDIDADVSGATSGLNEVQEEVEETEEKANSTREAFAQWGMILQGYQAALEGIQQVWSVLSAPLEVSGEFEQYNVQFEVMLGNAEAARQRMEELHEFSKTTPFELQEVASASVQLQTLTRGALATGDGLRLVGDVAAGTRQRIDELATWFGRLYDGIQSGRAVGEAMMRLQELGAISGDARGQIEEMIKTNQDAEETWQVVTEAMSKFDGMMQKQSQTWGGLQSTFSDTTDAFLKEIGDRVLPAAKETLTFLIDTASTLTENFDTLMSIVKVTTPTVIAFTVAANASAIATKAQAAATKLATFAQKTFNTAVKANPLGLFITLLTGVVAALHEVTDGFNMTTMAMKDEIEERQKAIETQRQSITETQKIIEQKIEEAKETGATKDEIKKYREELEKTEKQLKELERTENMIKAREQAAEYIDELNSAFETFTAMATGSQRYLEIQAEESAARAALTTGTIEAQMKNAERLIEQAEKNQDQSQKLRLLKFINYLNNVKQLEDEAVEDHKETNKEKSDSDIQLMKLRLELMEEGRAKELEKLKIWYKEQQQQFEGNEKALTLLKEVYEKKRADIVEEYQQQEMEAREEALQEYVDMKIKEMGIFGEKEEGKTEKEKKEREKRLQALDRELRRKQDALNAELAMERAQGANSISIAMERYDRELELLERAKNQQLITEQQYDNELKGLKADTLQTLKQEYMQYGNFIADFLQNQLYQSRQYSDAEVELSQLQHEKELESLRRQLQNGEITREEYRLRQQVAEQQHQEFMKRVEEDRQHFMMKLGKEALDFAIDLMKQELAEWISTKLAEQTIAQTTEATKTATAQAGTMARIGLILLEIPKQLALAAASIATAIASAISWLVSTLGPLGFLASTAAVGGILTFWDDIKDSLGFFEGGYTGDGNKKEKAGVVHKGEYVFENSLTGKEPDNFQMLHEMLQSGWTLKDIFMAVQQKMNPVIEAPQALAGINLTASVPSQNSSVLNEIRDLMRTTRDEIKKLRKDKFNISIKPEKIEERTDMREFYKAFRLVEKVEIDREP